MNVKIVQEKTLSFYRYLASNVIVYNIKYLTIHVLVSVSLFGQFIGALITISPLVALLNNQLSLYFTSLQQNIKVLNLE